jgi:hypothetical protein
MTQKVIKGGIVPTKRRWRRAREAPQTSLPDDGHFDLAAPSRFGLLFIEFPAEGPTQLAWMPVIRPRYEGGIAEEKSEMRTKGDKIHVKA